MRLNYQIFISATTSWSCPNY